MIKIRTDLYGTDDTIVRPVVETVIRDVLTMLGIDKEIPTRFEQGGLIKKKTKKGAVVSINAPLSELIEIEYNETGADNNDLSLHLVRPDQLPFYRDPEVFTSILPITLKRKCTLVFKYFDKSKSRVSAIANDLRMKPALDNCYRLHDLEYTMEKIFERYELLCKDVTHQIGFLNDYYQMDFEYLQETLDEMKELQKKIIQNQ